MNPYSISTAVVERWCAVSNAYDNASAKLKDVIGPRMTRWACRLLLAFAVLAIVAYFVLNALDANAITRTSIPSAVPEQESVVVWTFDDGSSFSEGSQSGITRSNVPGGSDAEKVLSRWPDGHMTISDVEQLLGSTVNTTENTENLTQDSSSGIIGQLLTPAAQALWSTSGDIVWQISKSDYLTRTFDVLLGENTGIYSVINALNSTVAQPTAHTILALMIMVQLFGIARRVSSGDVLPGFREIAIIVIFFVVFYWAIDHSMQICQGIYDAFLNVINQISSMFGSDGSTPPELYSVPADADGGAALMALITGIGAIFVAIAAFVSATAAILARGLQIYILALFSPIPFALLGADVTRQMGIGFLKNFVAVCLAGVILMLLVCIYKPLLLGIVNSTIGGAGIAHAFGILAVPGLLTIGAVKSGAWARDVFGG